MVASWPRLRSRDSSSRGPERVPVNDHLFGVLIDCPPAQNLLGTWATNGLVLDLTLTLVAATGQAASRHQQQVASGTRGGGPGREGYRWTEQCECRSSGW
jgi:hypothetical protein